jgi:hypothetical protein
MQLALRQRTDPVRGTTKVEGRDKSIDGMLLFKEFVSNFIATDPCRDQWHGWFTPALNFVSVSILLWHHPSALELRYRPDADMCRGKHTGLSCSDQGRVLAISLPSNQLTGTIPPDIGNLTAIRGLHLGGTDSGGIDTNNIIGEIPEDLGQLYQLESLSLDHNLLSGSIPSIFGTGKLTRLTSLRLSHNRLFGPLPDLSQLTQLEKLDIDHNWLQGPIHTIGNLTKLQHLDMSYNEFSGDLLQPLIGLPVLRQVLFHGNAFAATPTPLSPLGAALPPHLSSDVNKLSAAALPVDKAVLIDLFDALAGHSWHIRTGWQEPQSDPCLSSWFGVSCDDNGRVISLALNRNNLTGVCPPPPPLPIPLSVPPSPPLSARREHKR